MSTQTDNTRQSAPLSPALEQQLEALCTEAIGENGKGVYDLAELTDLMQKVYTAGYLQGQEDINK